MIGVIGGGAFGTALAIALSSDGTDVRLWMRKDAEMVQKARQNARRLPEIALPKTLTVTGQLDDLNASQALLLALPAQQTASFLTSNLAHLPKVPLLLCAKGIALDEMKLQSDLVMDDRSKAILTGPGFAGEIASGLPTALTLASQDDGLEALQELLSRPKLRLYRSEDIIGAQLGGALKNVIAIAAGIVMGAGLGESARAAVVTRGFAEMCRLAHAMGAENNTLNGLSGLGDLMLSCASDKSRNFAFGQALGQGATGPEQTTEGIATAKASVQLALLHKVDMPVAAAVADVLGGASISAVMERLLSRPLRAE